MANFFIGRPVFASVIAIIIMLAGAVSLPQLPIEQYPDIAPPSVTVSAVFPGASAQATEEAVTQVLEQQMKGLDGLKYIRSNSNANGSMSMVVTFESGTDPDIAQVQVQNKLSRAMPLLPGEVQRRGIFVDKARTGFLMIVALTTEDGSMSETDLADYIVSDLQEPISRVEGVGGAQLFASQYAMRIWVNPHALADYGLSTQNVVDAIRSHNAQVTGGELGGQPSIPGQQLNASILVQSLMQTPEEFRAIPLLTGTDGSQVTLGDVARVEIGSDNYGRAGSYNGIPTAGLAVQLASGANALDTARGVRETVTELAKFFPEKVKVAFPYDTTPFIDASIRELLTSLLEAALFVAVIMFVFLQSFRATAIVMITVPVVLLGTLAVLFAFGFSINTLTMLAMVLALGLLVDDAIVVIENVERVMHSEGLPPLEATRRSMAQITSALVGIGAVLAAVFVPMAFFGGTAGAIYRQFSITIVSAMLLSVMVAIVLTPALCAVILRRQDVEEDPAAWDYSLRAPLRAFTRFLAAVSAAHLKGVETLLTRGTRFLLLYLAITAAALFAFVRIEQAFLPNEDQGIMLVQAQLPVGATMDRTLAVLREVGDHFRNEEQDTVFGYYTVAGFNFGGAAQNAGVGFIRLNDWDVRRTKKQSSFEVASRAIQRFSHIRDALVFAFTPPAVPSLGQSNGFDLFLQDRAGLGHEALISARQQLIQNAGDESSLVGVRASGMEDLPQLRIDVDHLRASAMGLSPSVINSTIATAMGGLYVNDYLDRGRTKKVYLAADAPYRMTPDDLRLWYIPNNRGELVPFSSFATTSWTTGPANLERFNGVPAVEILGSAAAGVSSGAAMATVEKLVAGLPDGFGIEWTGLSEEEIETGAEAPLLYAFSILIIFLCLAALYESWIIPVSVMLVVPLGLVGAVVAAYSSSLVNDIFFQVGLLTTIGLSAKNAILIVEFARKLQEQEGMGLREAALEAARIRLRPILMTSLAFGFGVMPLVLSHGAGATGRNEIGTAVLGGMIAAAGFGVFYAPLFFTRVRALLRRAPANS